MVQSGTPNSLGGSQPIPNSLLRSNSSLLGGQGGGGMPSQGGFPSMVSQRTQYGNVNMVGNMLGSSQRGVVDNGVENDPLSRVGNGMGFNQPSSSLVGGGNQSGQVQGQQFSNPSGNQMLTDLHQSQQVDPQNFQHNQQPLQQFSTSNNTQQQQHQQQQFQAMRAGVGGAGSVKMDSQVTNDQTPQQLQALRNLGTPQQIQNMRSMSQVKMEPQHSDSSLFLQQQQQRQQQQQQHQLLQMSRQSPQGAPAAQLLHQHRLLQQHQQQQQLLKGIPPQRSPVQPQNLPIRSPVKPVYEPGMCARRLTHYMYQQQHRPEDNNIEFWRKFVAEFFAPNAKKKWCVSMYGSGRQTTGVFPQDVWLCEICSCKPARGFEATVEVLPRLFKIKYESGTLEELLYVDMPREYQNASGKIVLDYAKAIQESVFEQLRVVRDGQLRIVFSQDLKICSWEFCARRHEELIPRKLLIPQVNQLGAAAQKYQAATQNASAKPPMSEIKENCNMFVASARQMAKACETPSVNDLGYSKRYVRCLQISEVVNSMIDLIDYSKAINIGPMESLVKFPRRSAASSGFQSEDQLQQQQPPRQQAVVQNSNNDTIQAAPTQVASGNGMVNVNNSLIAAPMASSAGAIAGLIHQNSMNSRQQNPINGADSPYGGNGVHMPSPGPSSTLPQPQGNPSPFQSPTPSPFNNPPQTSQVGLPAGTHMNSANSPNISSQQPTLSGDVDGTDSQSSVQKILQEMMSSQLGGGGMVGNGSMGNDAQNGNGMLPTNNNIGLNGSNNLIGNGGANIHTGVGGAGFGSMNNGIGHPGTINGIRAALGNNSMGMTGRAGMSMGRDQSMNQQEDVGNQLLNGYGNLNFDWKSP